MIEGEHLLEDDSLSLLSFTGETKKKKAINSTFNKTQSQKIYSNYAKSKKRYCFQSEHVLKSCTVASPTIKKRHAEMLYYQASKYAKPSGKKKPKSS